MGKEDSQTVKKIEQNLSIMRNAQIDFASVRTTQIGCALNVLKESIECVKMSIILPKLLEKPESLKILAGTPYEPAIKLVDDYTRRRDFIVKEQRPPLSDHGMIKLIDYFQSNHQIYKQFPDFMNRLTQRERKLLLTFEQLYIISEHHLLRNSKKEIIKERKLHQLYQENESIKISIKNLMAKIASKHVQMRWKMASKAVYLQKCEEKLNYKNLENETRMQNESDKCQRIIRANKKISLENQTVLEEKLKNLNLTYKIQAKENIKLKKEARMEKNKLELQLQAMIKKYDHTISQKIIENLDLQKLITEEKARMDKLMVIYRKEQNIYNRIVVKREEEEEHRKENGIYMYMMNRAARKIQRFWRKWRKVQTKKMERISGMSLKVKKTKNK